MTPKTELELWLADHCSAIVALMTLVAVVAIILEDMP